MAGFGFAQMRFFLAPEHAVGQSAVGQAHSWHYRSRRASGALRGSLHRSWQTKRTVIKGTVRLATLFSPARPFTN